MTYFGLFLIMFGGVVFGVTALQGYTPVWTSVISWISLFAGACIFQLARRRREWWEAQRIILIYSAVFVLLVIPFLMREVLHIWFPTYSNLWENIAASAWIVGLSALLGWGVLRLIRRFRCGRRKINPEGH